jgi:sugar lactone lactonase YvrE
MSPLQRTPSVLASGFSFLESPRWHDGRLYVSDFHTHRVLAIDSGGAAETVAFVPGQPGGLGFAPDGSLLVVAMNERRLLRADGDELEQVADLSDVAAWSLNDMVVDRLGRAYVGQFGFNIPTEPRIASSSLALVDADGGVRLVADELVFPNGTAITDDGRTLLIAETFAARVSAFDVAPDGSLGNRRTWASFAETVGETIFDALQCGAPLPDGIALDAEGALWMGDLTGRGALRVAPGGAILETIGVGSEAVYAVALGSADRRTLYLCVAPRPLDGDPATERRGRLLSCRVEVPGAGLP